MFDGDVVTCQKFYKMSYLRHLSNRLPTRSTSYVVCLEVQLLQPVLTQAFPGKAKCRTTLAPQVLVVSGTRFMRRSHRGRGDRKDIQNIKEYLKPPPQKPRSAGFVGADYVFHQPGTSPLQQFRA